MAKRTDLPSEQQAAFAKQWKAVQTFLSALPVSNGNETKALHTVLSIGDRVLDRLAEDRKEALKEAVERKKQAEETHKKVCKECEDAAVAYNESVKAAKKAPAEEKEALAALVDANKNTKDAAKATMDVTAEALREANKAHDEALAAHEEVK